MSLRQIFSGTATGVVHQIIVIALQIALVPVVIRLAGAEANGAFTILMQLVGWGGITTLGLGVAAGREMAQSYGTASALSSFPNTLCTVRGMYWATNVCSALFVATAAFSVPFFIVLSDDLKTREALASQIRAAGSLYAVWIVLRTPWSLFCDALRACMDVAAANIIAGISSILRLCLALGSVFCGMSVLGLALSTIAAELVAAWMSRRVFYKLHPEFADNPGVFDWRLIKALLKFGMTYLIVIVSGQLAANTGGILIGSFFGALAVSVAYTSQMPALMLGQLVWKLADSMGPFVNHNVAQKSSQTVSQSYVDGARWNLLFALPLAAGIVFYNHDVVRLWVGEKMFAGSGFTNAVAASAAIEVLVHFQAVYFVALGNVYLLGLLGITANIVRLAVCSIFGEALGLPGMAWITAASQFAVLVVTTCSLGRTFVIGFSDLVRDVLIRPTVVGCVCTVATVLVRHQLPAALTWPALAIHLGVFGVVWLLAMWFMGLTSLERTRIAQLSLNTWSRISVAR